MTASNEDTICVTPFAARTQTKKQRTGNRIAPDAAQLNSFRTGNSFKTGWQQEFATKSSRECGTQRS